jgi:predicted dithiol-disulfide oxidoreductase (DUF899 family)
VNRLKPRDGQRSLWLRCDSIERLFGAQRVDDAFIPDGETVFRTYFINRRGDEAMGSTWAYLDITAFGRQEEWEDSPEGYPQTSPYAWWNYRDAYGKGA